MKQFLSPTLDDVRSECVLMQAWKKTASYLRSHSWYADTFEIDYQSLRIPKFLGEIQERLETPLEWTASPLDFVPAPKGQAWRLRGDIWETTEKKPDSKIRPLAHIHLQDQVVATALLMCLADKVERTLGDPLTSIEIPLKRRSVLAYGHRLFCDNSDGLRHRWGSSKLYRLFYRDYQTFLRRPEVVSSQMRIAAAAFDQEIAIVQSDLSKFYDRVRPALLHRRVRELARSSEHTDFHELFKRVFDWTWKDGTRTRRYADLHNIENFDRVALPQGLVASGFFANVALRSFENALRSSLDGPIDPDGRFILEDVCYYVDDLRLVLIVEKGSDEKEIESTVFHWLQSLLNEHAPGLIVEESKTKAVIEGRQSRFLVPQSKTANRIQKDVSGVFDMLHGTELIGAIEGFFHTQKRYSSQSGEPTGGQAGLLVGISDLRDETAARFAAGRFRRTFRSLRPLLAAEGSGGSNEPDEDEGFSLPSRLVLSREQLDERGRLFAAMLIDEWVANPGNVRLLRIALDLYPDADFLNKVLTLLRPGWEVGGARGANREVRQYCLAEIFRAGATETGMVGDGDCLPSAVDLNDYHDRLTNEAVEVFAAAISTKTREKRFPWFLLQQAFLYLLVRNRVPDFITTADPLAQSRLFRYQRFARFLAGEHFPSLQERAGFLVLADSAFRLEEAFVRLPPKTISSRFLAFLAEVSPGTAARLWDHLSAPSKVEQIAVAKSLGLVPNPARDTKRRSLGEVAALENNPFWNEENLLLLASELLANPDTNWPKSVTPWQIDFEVRICSESPGLKIQKGSVRFNDEKPSGASYFEPPNWCEDEEDRRRFQLGALLRYALRGRIDFYGNSESAHQKRTSRKYGNPTSHWERQRYSTFQGRTAFGPPWIPISTWTEDFLFDLLRWPGAGISSPPVDLNEWRERLATRLKRLRKLNGKATKLTFLEQLAPWPDKEPSGEWERPLRVGIVQSVIPNMADYGAHSFDPQLNQDPSFRIRQRQHLASLLEAVVQLLNVRETHRRQQRTDGLVLDLLIFPELAIHPRDVRALILPFVQSQKCIVLFGQVFHPRDNSPDAPLVNTCLWAIPEWRATSGFQVKFVEQGKEHLTAEELQLNPPPVPFRPAQWLVNYRWSSNRSERPLTMSASICYDATDLSLASDLKTRSDLYIVCALNRDVGTFDRMSEGLHYHMFQGVIVVNNGQFGGSCFYMPYSETFHRQVLHLHGQPQATVAFAEISPRKLVGRDSEDPSGRPEGSWKTPPANWRNPHS